MVIFLIGIPLTPGLRAEGDLVNRIASELGLNSFPMDELGKFGLLDAVERLAEATGLVNCLESLFAEIRQRTPDTPAAVVMADARGNPGVWNSASEHTPLEDVVWRRLHGLVRPPEHASAEPGEVAKDDLPGGAFQTDVNRVGIFALKAHDQVLGAVLLGLDNSAMKGAGLEELKTLFRVAGILLHNARLREGQANEILYLREHDDLVTKLPNRVCFRRRLQEAFQASESGVRPAILFADLDRFNEVNTQFGYHAGDTVLKEVGQRWRQVLNDLSPSALLARIGGDEFAVLLQDPGDSLLSTQVAQQMMEALREPFHLEGRHCALTASIGIACHPNDGHTASALLRAAEKAMVAVKEGGKAGWGLSAGPAGDGLPPMPSTISPTKD